MSSVYTLITGASSGVGKELAIKLSSSSNVIIHGRDEKRLEETLSLCDPSHDHRIWQYDLNKVDGLFEALKEFLCTNELAVESFIHCAGTLKILPIKNFELIYSQEILNINFFSAVEIIRGLLKKFNHHTLANILFISAIWSKLGDKGNSIYAASKGALDSLVKTLAVELGPKVRVNSILPGAIKTKMTESAFSNPDVLAQYNKDYILGVGDVEDIIHMVEFLISSKAKWITGQHLILDGGKTSH